MKVQEARPHRIVIVGGGAGGLELATRLGDTIGRKGEAEVLLVDCDRTHLWKPLLHEVAAGSMDPGLHSVDYLAQAHEHSFRFRPGTLEGLDRRSKRIHLAAVMGDDGTEVLPAHSLAYDTLVIAVGSLTNDFGTPGVSSFAISLDTAHSARQFHRRLVNAFLRASWQTQPRRPEQLSIVIIGAGATGVELAAELRNTSGILAAYSTENKVSPGDISLTIIEAAPRILSALPERLSRETHRVLKKLGVNVHTGELVTEVTQTGVRTRTGLFVPAELVVWAAGIKAPDFLKDIGGLETNRNHQMVVLPTLQTTRDENVFAFGDCAQCPWIGNKGNVPARAQAAHQQAAHLARNLPRRLHGHAMSNYRYRDFGSLVSLGSYSTVGNLMGAITGGTLWVEGHLARVMYVSLYKQHELALHGLAKVVLETLARSLSRRTEPRVKLH